MEILRKMQITQTTAQSSLQQLRCLYTSDGSPLHLDGKYFQFCYRFSDCVGFKNIKFFFLFMVFASTAAAFNFTLTVIAFFFGVFNVFFCFCHSTETPPLVRLCPNDIVGCFYFRSHCSSWNGIQHVFEHCPRLFASR